jgi:tetratricopeptide (TPR) repeat protein
MRSNALYLLGIEAKQWLTKEDNKKAQELLTQAITLAPDFARAYVGLAWCHVFDANYGWTDDPILPMDQFADSPRKAVALDDTDAEAHLALGMALLYHDRQIEDGNNEIERALAIGPNNADVSLGEIIEAEHGHGKSCACDEAQSALSTMVPDPAVLFRVSWLPMASAAAADLMRLDPNFSAEGHINNDVFLNEAVIKHFFGSIEKAGLPLCATEAHLAKYPDMNRLERCEQQRAKS